MSLAKEPPRTRDATLVSVLAYAGLRPGEALALRWNNIGDRSLIVEHAVSFGEIKATKTGQVRSVRLLAPLAADLETWRSVSEPTSEDSLVFPNRAGTAWSEFDLRNWRKRCYIAAAKATGVVEPRPYDLRHSFASLMFAEGMNAAEIAGQLGHSLQTLLGTYVNVIEDFRGQPRIDAADEIRAARSDVA